MPVAAIDDVSTTTSTGGAVPVSALCSSAVTTSVGATIAAVSAASPKHRCASLPGIVDAPIVAFEGSTVPVSALLLRPTSLDEASVVRWNA